MFRHWLTTVAGFAAGGLNLYANGMNWKQALLSTGLVVLGAVSSDFNKAAPPPATGNLFKQ